MHPPRASTNWCSPFQKGTPVVRHQSGYIHDSVWAVGVQAVRGGGGEYGRVRRMPVSPSIPSHFP